MRCEPSEGFPFELPEGWRSDEHNRQIVFFGPEGRIGSTHQVFQIQIGKIHRQYHSPEARERFLREPGATVSRAVVGDEKNAIALKKSSNSEISVVRDGIHYAFAHGHDPETLRAIEMVKETARFPVPEVASSELDRCSDRRAQTIDSVLGTRSPEEARDTLGQPGFPGKRVPGGTLHDLERSQRSSKRKIRQWWQFWK